MKTLIALIACVLATGALAPAAQAEDDCLPVDIVISPKTLNRMALPLVRIGFTA